VGKPRRRKRVEIIPVGTQGLEGGGNCSEFPSREGGLGVTRPPVKKGKGEGPWYCYI